MESSPNTLSDVNIQWSPTTLASVTLQLNHETTAFEMKVDYLFSNAAGMVLKRIDYL